MIQAVGGGSASAAFNKEPPGNPKPGTDTMVAGIAFQLFATLVFALFFARVIWSARVQLRAGREIKLVAVAIGVSLLVMIIRGIYRTIELAQGWTGFLIRREGYFIALDGVTMVVATVVFNVYNPGSLLDGKTKENDVTLDGLERDEGNK